ncbi:hypothetical protein C8Q73DRAFT_716341 [Cubamyces lactineus]|nr:hypothetical protein C8Q73DRAFT_716341 [Cubamyces lactineus]
MRHNLKRRKGRRLKRHEHLVTLATMPSGPNATIPSATSPAPPKVPALDNTFGAIQLGTFVGLIVYGITLHQYYRYVRSYPGDSRVLKGLVLVIVLLETWTTVLSMHTCYYYLTTNYFHPEALENGVWSLNLLPVSSAVVMLAAQSFFARRVWILGRGFRPLVVVVSVLCVAEFAFFAAASTEAFTQYSFAKFSHYTWLVSTGFTLAMAADWVLMFVLIYILHSNRTGFQSTDSMIDLMILYTVNTGVLTGIVDLLSVIFAFYAPQHLIYIALGIVGKKLYATTLLAALNSRNSLKTHGQKKSPYGYSMSREPVSTRNGHRIGSTSSDEASPAVFQLQVVGSGGRPSAGSAPDYKAKEDNLHDVV